VKRVKRIAQRRLRPAKPQLQPRELNRPPLDLSRAVYLSARDAAQYLGFTEWAFYKFLERHPDRLPKGRLGRLLRFHRRDLDAAVRYLSARKHAKSA